MEKKINAIEKIILSHSSRGMELLSEYMQENFCKKAARKLYELKRGTILITTGFYVKGYAETDGPMGAFFMARALNDLGFECRIVTDELCNGFFDKPLGGLRGAGIETICCPVEAGRKFYEYILDECKPVALISTERCGINTNGDYANMRGVSIARFTARIDMMFDIAMEKGIYTIGIGDGGNEIGMGNLAKEISGKLSLVPCSTRVDDLLIATVSNWGAYGLICALDQISGNKSLPTFDELKIYLKETVSMGSVDGVKGEQIETVDGHPIEDEEEIISALHELVG